MLWFLQFLFDTRRDDVLDNEDDSYLIVHVDRHVPVMNRYMLGNKVLDVLRMQSELVVVIELGVGVGWLSGFCITSSSSPIVQG